MKLKLTDYMISGAKQLLHSRLTEYERAGALVRHAARAGVARIDYLFERLHDGRRVFARGERHTIKVMNLRRRLVVRSGDAFHDAGEPVLPRRDVQFVHVHSPVAETMAMLIRSILKVNF